MNCLTCSTSALRDPTDERRDAALRAMARVGFINCTASEGRALFKPFGGRCAKFSALEAEAAAKRVGWASAYRGRRSASALDTHAAPASTIQPPTSLATPSSGTT